MIYVKIVDQNGKEVEVEDLTVAGKQDVLHKCRRMIEEIEESE